MQDSPIREYLGDGHVRPMPFKVGGSKWEAYPSAKGPRLSPRDADGYEGSLHWEYGDVGEDGSWGEAEEEEIFDFLSSTYAPQSPLVCPLAPAMPEDS